MFCRSVNEKDSTFPFMEEIMSFAFVSGACWIHPELELCLNGWFSFLLGFFLVSNMGFSGCLPAVFSAVVFPDQTCENQTFLELK